MEKPQTQRVTLRKKHVLEVYKTEREFITDLEKIVQYYKDPLLEKGIITVEQAKIIFSNVTDLPAVNKLILADIDAEFDRLEGMKGDIGETALGRIFISFCERDLAQYTEYCSNQPQALALLAELNEENQDFVDYCKDLMENEPAIRGLSIGGYVIKPVQRLCKYPLFIRELLSCTDEEKPDHAALLEAQEKVGEVVARVNEIQRAADKKAAERQADIADIANKIEGAEEIGLVDQNQNRFLQRMGTLKLAATKKSQKSSQNRSLILFNDLIVISAPNEKKKGKGAKTEILVWHCKLGHLGVVDLADSQDGVITNAFEFFSKTDQKQKRISLSCEDLPSKREWIKDIRQLVKDFQRQNAQRLKNNPGSPIPANLRPARDVRGTISGGKDLNSHKRGTIFSAFTRDKDKDKDYDSKKSQKKKEKLEKKKEKAEEEKKKAEATTVEELAPPKSKMARSGSNMELPPVDAGPSSNRPRRRSKSQAFANVIRPNEDGSLPSWAVRSNSSGRKFHHPPPVRTISEKLQPFGSTSIGGTLSPAQRYANLRASQDTNVSESGPPGSIKTHPSSTPTSVVPRFPKPTRSSKYSERPLPVPKSSSPRSQASTSSTRTPTESEHSLSPTRSIPSKARGTSASSKPAGKPSSNPKRPKTDPKPPTRVLRPKSPHEVPVTRASPSAASGGKQTAILPAAKARAPPVDETQADIESLLRYAGTGEVSYVAYMIETKKVSVNATNFDGRTALHAASTHGHLEVVRYLIMCGATFDLPDVFGQTPYDNAITFSHVQIVALLAPGGRAVSPRKRTRSRSTNSTVPSTVPHGRFTSSTRNARDVWNRKKV